MVTETTFVAVSWISSILHPMQVGGCCGRTHLLDYLRSLNSHDLIVKHTNWVMSPPKQILTLMRSTNKLYFRRLIYKLKSFGFTSS